MAWSRGTLFVRISRPTRFLAEHQVQVMVFPGMVLVLTGLDLLVRFRELTGGESTQEDHCEQGNYREWDS
jgi:hypothetical protein